MSQMVRIVRILAAGLLMVLFALPGWGQRTPEEAFFAAIKSGRAPQVEQAIAAGVDANALDAHGRHPLILALRRGNAFVFDTLLDAGATLPSSALTAPSQDQQAWLAKIAGWAANTPREEGERRGRAITTLLEAGILPERYREQERLLASVRAEDFELVAALTQSLDSQNAAALCLAIERDDSALFDDLLARDWPLLKCDRQISPFTVAALAGKVRFARALLAAGGADLDQGLLDAARGGSAEIARMLLTAGADVNFNKRVTPLVVALEAQHLDMATTLLKAGADPNLIAKRGNLSPPLVIAIRSERPDLVRLLLDFGADSSVVYGQNTMLEIAQATKVPEIVAMIGATDPEAGGSVFTGLIETCEPDIVTEYLAVGGSPSAVFETGPAVHIAIHQCRGLDILDLLLAAGADIDQRDGEGRTAFWRLAGGESPSLETLTALVERGADPNILGPDGDSALMRLLAGEDAAQRWTEILSIPGLDLEHGDSKGRTVLLRAAAAGRWDLYRALLEAGADVQATDEDGRPLPWFKWQGLSLGTEERTVRTPYAQVSFKVPFGYWAATSRIKSNIRKGLPSEARGAANVVLATYLSTDVRPIVVGLEFEPRVEEVTPEVLERIDPNKVWDEEIVLPDGRRVIGASVELDSVDRNGQTYVESRLFGVVPWSPYPLVAFMSGPKEREGELRWMLEGFILSLEKEPSLGAEEVVRTLARTHAEPLRMGYRIAVLVVGLLVIAVLLVIRRLLKPRAASR